MKKLAPDPKFIGADLPGFFGVLHTWGRQLQYHPHIHYVVPGGAISTHDLRWDSLNPPFYLPFPSACAPRRLHEGPLLRLLEPHLPNTPRGSEDRDRDLHGFAIAVPKLEPLPPATCSHCGGVLSYRFSIRPPRRHILKAGPSG